MSTRVIRALVEPSLELFFYRNDSILGFCRCGFGSTEQFASDFTSCFCKVDFHCVFPPKIESSRSVIQSNIKSNIIHPILLEVKNV